MKNIKNYNFFFMLFISTRIYVRKILLKAFIDFKIISIILLKEQIGMCINVLLVYSVSF